MKLTDDIVRYIDQAFGKQADIVEIQLYDYIKNGPNYLKSERLVRCILHLAEGDLESLKHFIAAAKDDPRDVIFWAEYENRESKDPVMVRDFSEPFEG